MISEKELQEAARLHEIALLHTLPEPEDCEAAFSPVFERKMEKLIFRTDHPIRYGLLWLFRILLVLLAAGLIAAAVLLPGRQAGEPPARPESSAPATPTEPPSPSAGPQGQESQEPEPTARTIVYRPTWLPEGCEWDRETLYDNEGMIVYRTPGGTEAVFLYDLTGGSMEAEGREVAVGDGVGLLLLGRNKEELNELFWADDENGVSFWLSAPFEEEDMIRVAESVQAEE